MRKPKTNQGHQPNVIDWIDSRPATEREVASSRAILFAVLVLILVATVAIYIEQAGPVISKIVTP